MFSENGANEAAYFQLIWIIVSKTMAATIPSSAALGNLGFEEDTL